MKNLLRKAGVLIVAGMIVSSVSAQEEKGIRFNVSGDLVSSYIWRGQYQTGVSLQPTLGLSVGGFSLTAWGSTDFEGTGSGATEDGVSIQLNRHKEVDLTAAYTIHNFTVSVADLWWGGQGASEKYFMFENHRTQHMFEGGLAYSLPCEKFPLSIAWYTMFAGGDHNISDNGKSEQAYSTYIEMGYPFSIKGINLVANLGVSPWESQMQYGNENFAVTNLALKATKEIKITDRFVLPVFTQIIWNPNKEDVHFVLGITLK